MGRVLRRTFLFTVPAILGGTVLLPAPAAEPDCCSFASRIDAVIDGPDYKHATWGLLVTNEKGKAIFARNPDSMLAPASVTKLFTCSAALVALGPDHTFDTCVYQRGLKLNGKLLGDLILVASGDPTLGGRTGKDGKLVFRDHDHTYANSGLMESELTETDPLAGLNELARQVKEAGIDQISGEVLIDDRLFSRSRGSGSGPDAVTPITVNDNVIDVVVEPGPKEGEPAKVTTRPETALIQVDALVATAAEDAKADIQLAAVGPNQFAVRGRIPVKSKPLVRIYPIDEPALFARALFIESLRRHGVQATAAIHRNGHAGLPDRGSYDKLTRVATFTSPPLEELVKVTLKVSHNLYASTLPSLVASSEGRSTSDAGLRAERKIWEELGVDVDAVSFGGGAGGAPSDFVTPRAVVQLLRGMSKRPEWKAFKTGLPVLGVDGTLADVVKPDSPAKGKVRAKTGTLIWFDAANDRWLLKSKALAGVMTTKAGTTLYFAMMVNNVPVAKDVGSAREGKTLAKLCEILYEHGQ